MRYILLSIKQRHAEAILTGRKVIELRRTRPGGNFESPWACEDDVIYLAYGGYIHGCCRVNQYEACDDVDYSDPHPCGNWARLASLAAITPEEMRAYAPLWAWRIYEARRFLRPVSLADLGVQRAPQSWQYLTDLGVRAIEGRAS